MQQYFKSKNFTSSLFLILIVTFSLMPSLKYAAIHTAMMDFGIFLFHFYSMSFGEWEWIFLGHNQLFHLPYFFIFSHLPENIAPYFLLIMQGFFLLLPAYLIYLSCGKIVAFAYLLYFPLWFNLLFDFHLDHLSVLFLTLFFLSVKSKRFALATFSAILLALVKEPFALQTAMCGFYLLAITYKNDLNFRLLLYSVGLITFGFIFFYFSLNFIIISNTSGVQLNTLGGSAFSYLGSNIGEMLIYMFTNPIEILLDIFSTPKKLIFILALFGALGFIPLLKPGPLIVAMPIFIICLLSQNENYYALGHHYTAGLIAPMIFSFSGGLNRAKIFWEKIKLFPSNWFMPLLIFGLVFSNIMLSSSPISRLFWSDKIWSYSYKAYILNERDSMIKKAIKKHISSSPDTLISVQNTVNWYPLLQRRHFLVFPQGVDREESVPNFDRTLLLADTKWKNVTADYVVVDLKRPWYLGDKGCDWRYGKCTNKKMYYEFLAWIEKTRYIMNVVFENDGFIIFRRIN